MTNENNENQTPQDEPQSPPEAQASQEPAPQQPAAPAQQTQAPSPTTGGGDVGKKIQDMANMQVGGFSLCKVVALAGASLLFLSFFLPWWGLSVETKEVKFQDLSEDEKKELEDDSKDYQDAQKDQRDFMEDVFSREDGRDFFEDLQKNNEASISAFGWDLSRGIVTFIFSFLIGGAVAAVMFVKPLQPFGMFVLLLAAILAFVVFILTLTVWFGTPGQNLDNILVEIDQGVSFGTFVALLGALGVLAGAGYEAVMGMMGFFKAQQAA